LEKGNKAFSINILSGIATRILVLEELPMKGCMVNSTVTGFIVSAAVRTNWRPAVSNPRTCTPVT
jgi:hypothetical protein